MTDLEPGDATFQKSFTLVGFAPDGDKLSISYRPGKGRQFVVLLLGDVPLTERAPDIDAMLAQIGYVPIKREEEAEAPC